MTITPEELATLRADHNRCSRTESCDQCHACEEPNPCRTIRLIDALEAVTERCEYAFQLAQSMVPPEMFAAEEKQRLAAEARVRELEDALHEHFIPNHVGPVRIHSLSNCTGDEWSAILCSDFGFLTGSGATVLGAMRAALASGPPATEVEK